MSRHRFALVVGIHAVLFALSLLLSLGLAYNFHMTDPWFSRTYLPLVPFVILIKMLVFTRFRIWRSSWRYVGLRDLVSLTYASWLSFFLFVVLFFAVENLAPFFGHSGRLFQYMPDSAFLMDFACTIALVAAVRIAVRFYYEEYRAGEVQAQARLLIVGAGDSGEALLREILRMGDARYEVVGFLDDAPEKLHARIHGVEVLGRIAEIQDLCTKYEVDEVMFAIPSAPPKEVRRIVELCAGMNLRFSTVPHISDLIEGRVQVSQVREVSIEDLLGRAPVTLDTEIIESYVRNKCIAVTGAGGSIGAEMCRQLALFGPRRLLLIERGENNLFEIERELRRSKPGLDVVPLVADICDRERMLAIFRQESPSAVFHAAAHKHVPLMDHSCNVGEAIKNNVMGTKNVADAAVATRVHKMVMISTDKAVNPTSVMGCTKRLAEMYVQQLSKHSPDSVTQFVTVRFGNVLGSSGSVIPIFKEQIRRGGPVTVTHPDMQRYFMTIPEAAQLVLQAGAMGHGGEIFVLDMGDPVRIVDLANDLITLSGFRPGEDIEIEFVGVRPGEKLYEELSIEGENVSRTRHPKIGIWVTREQDWQAVCQSIEHLRGICDRADDLTLRAALRQIVPEYGPQEIPAAAVGGDGSRAAGSGEATALVGARATLAGGTRSPGFDAA